MPVATFPQTVYSIALVYKSADDSVLRARCHMFHVSGETPLTGDEALARARKAIEAEPVMAGFKYQCGEVCYCVQAQKPYDPEDHGG